MSTTSSQNELLVFGYSCKLFRDDEKAAQIDRGQSLIPWMGHPDMHIDRYDGRGHLTDLRVFEAKEGLWEQLNSEEVNIERMCDEERYRSLHSNEAFEETEDQRQDERNRSQIGFNYDQHEEEVKRRQQEAERARHEQPSLRTLANCIEKTAEFIVTQGAQMEILMRAKEANNPKFQFLNPDNPYHPIYKQVVEKKKNRPKNYVANLALTQQNSLEVEKSLQKLVESLPTAAPRVGGQPTPKSSNAGSAYSQLVERIRVNQQPLAVTPTTTPPPTTPPPEAEVEPPPKPDHIVRVTPPPIALQPLIDKTAFYVAKNGIDKLAMVKKRMAEKFGFLFPDNKYNKFFQYKVALYKEMLAEEAQNVQKNGNSIKSDGVPSHDEQVQAVTKKFPTLKGFFT